MRRSLALVFLLSACELAGPSAISLDIRAGVTPDALQGDAPVTSLRAKIRGATVERTVDLALDTSNGALEALDIVEGFAADDVVELSVVGVMSGLGVRSFGRAETFRLPEVNASVPLFLGVVDEGTLIPGAFEVGRRRGGRAVHGDGDSAVLVGGGLAPAVYQHDSGEVRTLDLDDMGRARATGACAFDDGRVVLAGGANGTDAERRVILIEAGAASVLVDDLSPRLSPALVCVDDTDDVLVIGGLIPGGAPRAARADVEVIPTGSGLRTTLQLSSPRVRHAAAQLLVTEPTVLVVGGQADEAAEPLASADVLINRGAWVVESPVAAAPARASLSDGRLDALIVPVLDTSALVIGGTGSAGGAIADVEVFTPLLADPGGFVDGAVPLLARASASGTLLSTGEVMVAGADARAEIIAPPNAEDFVDGVYDFSVREGPRSLNRFDGDAVRLSGDLVFVGGGATEAAAGLVDESNADGVEPELLVPCDELCL